MKSGLFNFISHDIGIDLGTANTLVYVKGKGIIINEPTIVALNKSDKKITAVGNAAREMMGRTPPDTIVIKPLQDGVIADFEVTEEFLRLLIRRVQKNMFLVRPRIVVCVPTGITEVEKRAVKDASERAGARDVFLVAEPMAAAIGVGLPVHEPIGNMIIDIGGGTSEIAVIALSGIVKDTSIRVAGNKIDATIVQYIKKNYNLLIGDRSAEEIKCSIGSAYPLREELNIDIKGRDLVLGIPKTITVTSEEIRESLNEPVNAIVEAVKLSLEKTPPELASDILDRGIVMSGGGALLKGLDKRISDETNLPVHVADDPLLCVVKGAGRILDDMNGYKKVFIS
jgi:rod shape-determining protein MreB and related proteins